MKIIRTPEGKANLNIWRDGEEYLNQKGPILLKEWTNVLYSTLPQPKDSPIYYIDLSKRGLDCPENTFDAVNCYHIFEHFSPRQGDMAIQELKRVLNPGGILRISVPDMERNCREYLKYFEASLKEPSRKNLLCYQWTVMEIFEQMVRDKPGGLMYEYLKKGEYDQQYMDEFYSDVFGPIMRAAKNEKDKKVTEEKSSPHRSSAQRLAHGLRWRWQVLSSKIARQLGRKHSGALPPRESKEAVRWMYDRISLRLFFEKNGFTQVIQKTFKDSDIPHWDRYDLDRSNVADREIDPSVYMEGRKVGLTDAA